MEKYLPADIIYRRKQGFNIPVRDWLKGNLLNLVSERVLDGNLCKCGLVERAGVEKLIKLQTDASHNYNSMLMLLLAFESWIDAYQVRVGNVTAN